ncbi:MAG: hypothetical protein WDZ94_04705 [Patescibacteria group bacterium]
MMLALPSLAVLASIWIGFKFLKLSQRTSVVIGLILPCSVILFIFSGGVQKYHDYKHNQMIALAELHSKKIVLHPGITRAENTSPGASPPRLTIKYITPFEVSDEIPIHLLPEIFSFTPRIQSRKYRSTQDCVVSPDYSSANDIANVHPDQAFVLNYLEERNPEDILESNLEDMRKFIIRNTNNKEISLIPGTKYYHFMSLTLYNPNCHPDEYDNNNAAPPPGIFSVFYRR